MKDLCLELGGLHEIECADQIRLELFAGYDGVKESLFQKKLGTLKTFGQLLADGLLDDARAGKTDQRAGLADIEVAQHGKACSHSAGRGIGEHANVRHALVIELGKCGGYLRHL